MICQENIIHTITPPLLAWTFYPRKGWVNRFITMVPKSDPNIYIHLYENFNLSNKAMFIR